MNRRFGEPILADVTYRPRPGAYGVIHGDGQLLITYQGAPDCEFQLPGGGIDPGESPVAALHREVFEETGWGIQVQRRLGTYLRYTFMPDYGFWARKACHIYLCRATRRLGDIVEPNHTAHWVSVARGIALLENEGDRHFAAQHSPLR